MKNMILMGRRGCGKATLIQALNENASQSECSNDFSDFIIDTPCEYVPIRGYGHALPIYAWNADIGALMISAAEPFCIYPPGIACVSNRPVIGIVTQIDRSDAHTDQAIEWLRLSGADPIFTVSTHSGTGITELLEFLKES